MNKDFGALGLSNELITALKIQNINAPTEVQELAIPVIMSGKDSVIRAETGSGKTLSYLLPMFMKIDMTVRSAQCIILTPTHELAVQVHKQSELLAKNSGMDIRSALIIGNAGVSRQLEKLKEKPQIIIGSAGRIIDLIEKRKLPAHTVKTIIIDEADRMLDDLNINLVKAVVKTTLKNSRQTVFLSASMSTFAISAAKEISVNQPEICMTKENLPPSIEHFCIECELRDKINIIRKIVHGEKAKKTIVFINNPENIGVTVEKLCYHSLNAVGLYGGIRKDARKKAINNMISGKAEILVASDLVSRGLDIPDVTHVINMDIPENPINYLHRSGRTGRNGKPGKVISIATKGEIKYLNKCSNLLGAQIKKVYMKEGNMVPDNRERKPVKYSSLIEKKPSKGIKREK